MTPLTPPAPPDISSGGATTDMSPGDASSVSSVLPVRASPSAPYSPRVRPAPSEKQRSPPPPPPLPPPPPTTTSTFPVRETRGRPAAAWAPGVAVGCAVNVAATSKTGTEDNLFKNELIHLQSVLHTLCIM